MFLHIFFAKDFKEFVYNFLECKNSFLAVNDVHKDRVT